MKPGFALNLTHNGILLLHRVTGGWKVIAEAQPEALEFAQQLSDMRDKAAELEPGAVVCKLIIPDTQILYTTTTSPDPLNSRSEERQFVENALEGLTPYEVSDLALDWQRDGDSLSIAAIARETLAEAEAFATEHRFNPVSFTAVPGEGSGFTREVFFGETTCAASFMLDEEFIEREDQPLVIVKPGTDAPVQSEDATEIANEEPEPPAEPDPTDDDKEEAIALAGVQSLQPEPEKSGPGLAKIAMLGGGAIAAGVLAALWFSQSTPPAPVPVPIAETPEIAEPEAASEAGPEVETPVETAETDQPAPQPAPVIPTQEDAEDFYAENEIWILPPDVGQSDTGNGRVSISAASAGTRGTGNLYIPSHDPATPSFDALALPILNTGTTGVQTPQISDPATPGTTFAVNELGLVVPTPEGTENADGIRVFAGRPDYLIPPRPTDEPTTTESDAEEATGEEQPDYAGFKPRLRPSDLIENHERSIYGGLTLAELAERKPELRPESAQSAPDVDLAPTEFAVATSLIPSARPDDFAAVVAAAQAARAAAQTQSSSGDSAATASASSSSSGARSSGPSIPSSASVARQATIRNAIRLNRLSLVGIYNTGGTRRALMRTRNGRYRRVEVGDRIDGGRVQAIGQNSLQYVKGSRNITMELPGS